MKWNRRNNPVIITVVVLYLCTACGGGGDGIEGSGLQGTVATGEPLINTQVTIKGKAGNKVTTLTGSDGKYQVDVSNLSPPYLLKVAVSPTRDLYSIATQAGVANVHPYTDAVSRNWFVNKQRNIDTEFSSNNSLTNPPTTTEINTIVLSLNNILKVSYNNFQITQNFNFITESFDANHNGFDQLLDESIISIVNNQLDIKLIEQETKLETSIIILDLDNLLSTQDTVSPEKPINLQSFTSNESSLLLVWSAANDNVGVSGYNIYLDDNLIDQTPFPIYSATNLTAGSTVCYQVEAVDGANNTSPLSDELCITLDNPGQITNPLAPLNAVATPSGSASIMLNWTPSQSNNVLGYNIYRKLNQGNESKIATQVDSQFQDFDLISNSEYCYRVSAFNVLGNESDFSNSDCASTEANTQQNSAPPHTIASPAGQTYNTAQTVTLSCSDNDGANCVNIYYSINESDVTTNSQVYTSPITISENSTLRFFGIDTNNNQETAKQEVYSFTSASLDGIVQFSASEYQVDESVGAIEITASRVGDTSQAISVNFSASEDQSGTNTATPLADFTPVSGILEWQANETANKTFYIPIKGDAITESLESIRLALSANSENLPFGELASSKILISDSACINTLSEDILVDTVITETCTVVSGMVNVRDANLTLSPGITLVFKSGAGFSVESDGSFTANGSEAKPILLTAFDRARGYWQGLRFVRSNSSRNNLNYVTIEYGSGGIGSPKANLNIYGDSSSQERVNITNSTFTDGSDYGIVLSQNSIVDNFSNNTMSRNKLGPVFTVANVTHFLDAASHYSGNDVDYVEVGGGRNINTSQTWQTLNVPYLVDGLTANVDLKLSPGSELVFTDNSELRINSNGSLNAAGTENLPILFTSISQTPGAWKGIRFVRSNDNKNVLAYVTVEYGGDSSSLGTGNVILYGDSASAQRLKMTNSTLRYSSNNGFDFKVNSNISGFANNTITDNNGQTGQISIATVSDLDAESSYSGNGVDYIEIVDSNLNSDHTWKKLDADYLSNGISLSENLTLEAGIILHFEQGEELRINTTGSLTAIGTAAEPIIFTSDNNSAGDWYGIRFIRSNSSNNKIINAEVHYAGRSSTLGDGAISLYGDSSTHSLAEVRNTLVTNSANYPIWLHATAVINDDVSTTNTFENNNPNEVFRKNN